MSNMMEKKCQRVAGYRFLDTPGKCQKHVKSTFCRGPSRTPRDPPENVQWTFWMGSQMESPENVQISKQMSKSNNRCRNRIENVQMCTCSIRFRHFSIDFDIFRGPHFGRLQNVHLTFLFTFVVIYANNLLGHLSDIFKMLFKGHSKPQQTKTAYISL